MQETISNATGLHLQQLKRTILLQRLKNLNKALPLDRILREIKLPNRFIPQQPLRHILHMMVDTIGGRNEGPPEGETLQGPGVSEQLLCAVEHLVFGEVVVV